LRSAKNKTEGSLVTGGPLSRELTTLKMLRLVDFIQRSAQLAFTRISGLSDFQWRVISRVNELEPLSMNELSALLQRDVAQVSRAVKGMVAAGLLNRTVREGGPGVLITPTALGRNVYGPLRRLARKRNERFLSGLTADEVKVLEHCLETMTRNAKAVLTQEGAIARRESARRPRTGRLSGAQRVANVR